MANVSRFAALDRLASVVARSRCAGVTERAADPPVLIETFCADHGIRIVRRPLTGRPDSVRGLFENESRTIVVAPECTYVEHRFVVAHEIAHAILNHVIDSIDRELRLRIGPDVLAYLRTEPDRVNWPGGREKDCNVLGSALLMPSELFYEAAEQAAEPSKGINEAVIQELAQRFHVSPQAVANRLDDFTIHHYDGNGRVPHMDWDQVKTKPSGSRIESGRGRRARRTSHSRDIPSTDTNSSRSTRPRSKSAPPIIVEFAGTPGAGKDSTIRLVRDFLIGAFKLKVLIIDESIKRSKHRASRFWVDSIAITVQDVIEAASMNRYQFDVVLINRGPFDRSVLMEVHAPRDGWSKLAIHNHIGYLEAYIPFIHLVYVLVVDTDESLARGMGTSVEQRDRLELRKRLGLTEPDDAERTFSRDELGSMNDCYVKRVGQLQQQGIPSQFVLWDERGGHEVTNAVKAEKVIRDVLTASNIPISDETERLLMELPMMRQGVTT